MQRKISVKGQVYSLFKGTFARVVRRTPRGRPAGWEVRITDCGLVTKKVFPLEDLRTANDYARAAERERLFSHGATVRDCDRAAVNEYRRWEQAVREAGKPVPSLLEIVMEAKKAHEKKAAAATWAAARDAYLAENENGWTPKRRAEIFSILRRFSAALENENTMLDDITPENIAEAVGKIASSRAPVLSLTSRKYYTAILSTVWERACEKRFAETNAPAEYLRMLKTPKNREAVQFLTANQAQAFINAAADLPRMPAVFFLVLGLLTGIRRAERERLQWLDFRLDEHEPYINLPHGKAKTNQHRAVYLHGTHAAILRHFMPTKRKAEAAIVNKSNIDREANKASRAIAEAAGLTMSRNILRHTAATHLVAYLKSYSAAALELGNSEVILKKHYAGLVTHAEAEAFFSLSINT